MNGSWTRRGQELEACWNEEWRTSLLQAALSEVRFEFSATQFQIFDLNVFKDWTASEVAKALGVSNAGVYLAKHCVSASLKREMTRLEKEWEERGH